jgi:hypothetical protein
VKYGIWILAAALALAQDKPPATLEKPKVLIIPAGVSITVRMNEALSSKKNDVGDHFSGVLESAISANGTIAAERQSLVSGRIVSRKRGMQGDELALELVSVERPNGEFLNVTTDPLVRRNENSMTSGAVRAGSTAALGAAIGGIVGGGRGAAIGAGAGGAIGAAGAVSPGRPVEVKSETVLVFRLRDAIKVEGRRQ